MVSDSPPLLISGKLVCGTLPAQAEAGPLDSLVALQCHLNLGTSHCAVLCCTAGVPENDDDWEGLAAAVYRAVLQMLPASAMSWFGSLRDRSMAVATEVSSPAALLL